MSKKNHKGRISLEKELEYEKTNRAYESLLQLAASIIIFRKLDII